MKCTIHTYLLNDLYSQELADSQNNGEQTPDNKKYDWEDEMNVSSRVNDVEELKDSSYFLAGSLGDGSNFSIEVPKCVCLKLPPVMLKIYTLVHQKVLFQKCELIEMKIIGKSKFI